MIQYIEIISAGCPFVTIAAIFSARDSRALTSARSQSQISCNPPWLMRAEPRSRDGNTTSSICIYPSPSQDISPRHHQCLGIYNTLLTVFLILSKSWKSRWCWCDHWSGPGPRPEISSVSEPIWTFITQLADGSYLKVYSSYAYEVTASSWKVEVGKPSIIQNESLVSSGSLAAQARAGQLVCP